MSIIETHATMLSSLESALDGKKLMSVFTQMLSIMKEQQVKLDETEKKLNNIANFSPSGLESRMEAVEKLLDEFKLHIHGGLGDSSILERGEINPFEEFNKTGLLLTSSFSVDSDQFENVSIHPAISRPKTPASYDSPIWSNVEPEQPDSFEEKVPEPVLEPESMIEAEPLIQQESPLEGISEPEPEPELEQSKIEIPVQPTPAPTDEVVPEQETEAVLIPTETQEQPEPQVEPQIEPKPEVQSMPVNVEPVAVPPEPVKPPIPTRVPTPVHPAPIEVSKPVVPQPIAQPISLKLENPSESSTPQPTEHRRRSSRAQMMPLIMNSRRRMSVRNLPFLSAHRIKRILKELRSRGRVMLISRRLLEDARKKYANQSLKQKIDYLELDCKQLNEKMNKLKQNQKKFSNSIKHDLSFLFDQHAQNKVGLFDPMEEFLFFIKDTFDTMPQFHRFIKFLLGFFATRPDIISLDDMMKKVSDQMTITIQREIKDSLTHFNQQINADFITSAELMQSLAIPPAGSTSRPNSSAGPTQQSELQKKLQGMILHWVNFKTSEIEHTFNHFQQQLEHSTQQQLNQVLAQKGHGGSAISPSSVHDLELKSQQYTDDKLHSLKEELERIESMTGLKIYRIEEDLHMCKDKIHGHDGKHRETIDELKRSEERQEQERLEIKTLQKKIASISVDKLLDELKNLQRELNDRPSTLKMNTMMDSIENTFREHLGENVQGLKSLVSQVYRHIQNKVDREDIRKLIASKLVQMEKDLVRREEDMLSVATSTRCLSCGQLPREMWNNNSKQSRTASPARLTSQNSALSPPQSPPTIHEMDDESHGSSQEHSQVPPNIAFSTDHTEKVYNILTGQAGLKPLQLQHSPMVPAKDPYNNVPKTAGASLNKRKTGEKIPEPLYRKARLSSHLKEMVKVNPAAADNYGYSLNSNPMYVLEGSIVDESSTTFIDRDYTQRRPNTSAVPGSMIEYSNSLSSIPMRGTSSGQSLFSSTGGDSQQRNLVNRRKLSNDPAVVVLPDINSRAAANDFPSAPGTPDLAPLAAAAKLNNVYL